MNELTLRKLEYEKIVGLLSNECSSFLGQKVAESLQPSVDAEEIVSWQQETTEGVLVRRYEPNIPLGGIADVSRQLRKAEIGGMLEPDEFLQLLDVLKSAKRLNHFFCSP